MFGVNSFQQVGQIASGWAKDIVKAEQELHDERMAVCKECPLFTASSLIGPKCDSKKCWDTENNYYVSGPGKHFICGCGCALDKKTRVKSAKCVLDKWKR